MYVLLGASGVRLSEMPGFGQVTLMMANDKGQFVPHAKHVCRDPRPNYANSRLLSTAAGIAQPLPGLIVQTGICWQAGAAQPPDARVSAKGLPDPSPLCGQSQVVPRRAGCVPQRARRMLGHEMPRTCRRPGERVTSVECSRVTHPCISANATPARNNMRVAMVVHTDGFKSDLQFLRDLSPAVVLHAVYE